MGQGVGFEMFGGLSLVSTEYEPRMIVDPIGGVSSPGAVESPALELDLELDPLGGFNGARGDVTATFP